MANAKSTVELHGTPEAMEAWFRKHGVPHFMHRYSARSQVPDVAMLLCIVLAFEVGAAPWLRVDTVGMILSPLILFVLTLIGLPWLRVLFEGKPWRKPSGWSMGIRLSAIGVALVLLALSPLRGAALVTWMSFLLLLGVFAAATMLFSRRLWTDADPGHVRRRRILFGAIVVAVVVFGLEGSVFASFDQMLWDTWVPQGAPALVCIIPLVVFAARVARRCPESTAVTDTRGVAANFQLAATPLLLLFLGLEIALLPYSHPDPSQQGGIQLAGFILVLLLAAAFAAAGRRRSIAPSRGTVLLAVLAPLFVLAYPSLVWTYFELDAFGHTLTGVDAFLLSAGINLLYLAVVWCVVSLGLDRLAAWMAREAAHNVRGVAEGIARGLPLLLVVTVFLVIQAELWEVAVEVSVVQFWLLVGAMLIFALGAVVLSARLVVLETSVFSGLRDVEAAVAHLESDERAAVRAEVGASTRYKVQLKRVKYLNALAVIVVYQLLVLLPIAVMASIVFWVLGRIAVSASVAAEWVYGDDAGKSEAAQLAARTFWEEPWTRVALVLGAFSVLSLAVHILSDPEQRKLFCGRADAALRERLAMRLAYVWLVPADPVSDNPLSARARGWWRTRRLAQERESAGKPRDRSARPVQSEA